MPIESPKMISPRVFPPLQEAAIKPKTMPIVKPPVASPPRFNEPLLLPPDSDIVFSDFMNTHQKFTRRNLTQCTARLNNRKLKLTPFKLTGQNLDVKGISVLDQ